jgi:aminocarboxymuconate-semialdehyde decarboxylase
MELPVFIHPTKPYVDYIGKEPYGLFNTIGFTNDTSLCFGRMITSGFFDEFPKIKTIACHGGGALPYLAARFDRIWDKGPPQSRVTKEHPADYLRLIHFDALVFDDDTLDFLIRKVGYDRVLYGSDYPFRIADMKGVKERVMKRPRHEQDAIFSGNVKKLYDL